MGDADRAAIRDLAALGVIEGGTQDNVQLFAPTPYYLNGRCFAQFKHRKSIEKRVAR